MPTFSESDDIARRAAARLSSEFDPNLPALVEAQLQGGGAPQRFSPTGIAVAALVVQIVKFAWDVWRDLQKDGKPPPPDLLASRIRLEVPVDSGVGESERDRIIEIVVDEVMKRE
jgi:hypothetical protein